MVGVFEGFDLTNFWEKSEWADREYVDRQITDEMIQSIEDELGYKLPASYIQLMRSQNGGCPARTCHRVAERTSWAEDHVAITGIKGIGRDKIWSLCGTLGSRQLIDEWGYPAIGIYFGDCPSAGHDILCLDYSNCGPTGEPRVIHIDQEYDYKVTQVADSFEAFIRNLESEEEFDDDETGNRTQPVVVTVRKSEDFDQLFGQKRVGVKKPWWKFWR
jgi:SMI1-KNR4 cell-wall